MLEYLCKGLFYIDDINMHSINISNTHSAKHCVEPTFYDWCIDETDCFAFFRDLIHGPANYEQGEFWVPFVDIFVKEGTSDLAIVKLAYPVNFLKLSIF